MSDDASSFERLPIGALHVDPETLRIEAANPAAEALLATPSGALVDRNLGDYVVHTGPEALSRWIRELVSGDRSDRSRNSLRREDGSTGRFWTTTYVDHTAPSPRAVILFDELPLATSPSTAEANAAVRDWERRFQRTFDNIAVGVAHAAPNGLWLRVNDRLCEMLGYTRQELLERTVLELTHPSDRSDSQGQMDRLIRGEIDSYQLTKRYLRKDGSTQWAHITVMAEKDETGQLTYLSAIIQDVDELKRMEEALLQAREQAEAADRAKSIFLSMMSHEIRTPLTTMLGFASLLADDLEGEQQATALEIKRSGRQLTHTLNAVLTLARLESERIDLVFGRVELDTAVEEAARAFAREAADKGLDLRVAIDDPARSAEARLDRGGLTSILQHLLSNAVKFTHTGHLELRLDLLPPTSQAPHGVARLQVHDSGIGIAPDAQERIFEPFEQGSMGTTRAHGGTGVGLALVRQLTERMGGHIGVDSQLGVGSTFTVTFPLAEPATSRPTSDGTSGSGRGRVLVVEDIPQARKLLARILSPVCQPTVVGTAEEACELARGAAADGVPFDLLLLDIQLDEETDGEQLLQRLREVEGYATVPAIALTAFALPGDRERFLAAGFDDYVSKPFAPEKLLELIEETLAGSG